MTNSAPVGQLKTPLSEEKRAYMDETMEEARALASERSHSEARGPTRTEIARSGVSPAPVSAPARAARPRLTTDPSHTSRFQ
jgi:hypothetical protein